MASGIMELSGSSAWCQLSLLPLSSLPGDSVNPSCVTGELWLPLQRSLHCLCAECGADARPQRGVFQTSSSCTAPRCCELSCCLSLRKDTSREAPGIGDLPALDVIFGCPVSGAGLERFGSDSGLVQSVSSQDCLEKCPILCLAFRVLALL